MKLGPYNGGKSGAGVYQKIINQQPVHNIYVELCLGHGGVLRKKKQAQFTVGIDIDKEIIEKWQNPENPYELKAIHTDALSWLKSQINGIKNSPQTLIYFDPPYIRSSRKSKKQLYKYEMNDQEHMRILEVLKTLNSMVQVSGYENELYEKELANWRKVTFSAKTRQGMATEVLWMNYPKPEKLHTSWYIGNDYRERERIRKKRERWEKKIRAMSPEERQVVEEIFQAIGTTPPEVRNKCHCPER